MDTVDTRSASVPEDGEKIIEIQLERLRTFKNHPFKVRMDQEMIRLSASVEKYGIINPLIVRPIPDGVYEASGIDGAGKWLQFRKITFPLIAPFFTINMVLCMKNFLMVFDQIMSLTGGGPAQSTESISMLIYKAGFGGSQFGYQSANSVVYFIVIVVISLFQIKVLEKREGDL